MALPSIGAHCSVASCNLNDFLPIRCRCDQLFCKDHISPELHACPIDLAACKPAHPSAKLERCALRGCTKPSLEVFVSDRSDSPRRSSAVCPGCRLSFCAFHRDTTSHLCSATATASMSRTRNDVARSLLAKNFPSPSQFTNNTMPATSHPSKQPPNPKKAAQLRQVELMKMRHRALLGDVKDKGSSVPIDQRIHVKVKLSIGSSDERMFWFRKTIGTGKVLDLLASRFGLVGSDLCPLQLVKTVPQQDSKVVLQTDQLLVDQIEDGSLLVLVRQGSLDLNS
ncbi:hypothetical protein AcW1_005460 [Taiwanofungus camphoratus]|nr:hypothetical protein AcV5_005782 [Antrodia cinnamomea]KAI0948508.1 hypothetical protein AcV7_009230 [Antrodia cinnamomea]KAI0956884.1 hypothetical protein AcW1_005460 [Antrodia cinnamomea]